MIPQKCKQGGDEGDGVSSRLKHVAKQKPFVNSTTTGYLVQSVRESDVHSATTMVFAASLLPKGHVPTGNYHRITSFNRRLAGELR